MLVMYVTPLPASSWHMSDGFIRVKFDTCCENTSPLARLRVQACQREISRAEHIASPQQCAGAICSAVFAEI